MNMRNFTLAAATAAILSGGAFAQAPSGTISIVVPYGPGGATDLVARVIADGMQEALDNTVIVDNKPGAFGIVAIEYVGAANDDGTTLLMHNVTTGGMTPQLYADRISMDSIADFRPVARIASFPGVYVASTASDPAFTTPEELIAWAKENPGELRLGNAGLNSIPHVGAMLLELDAGIEINHIPATSGASGMSADIVNGDLHAAGLNLASTTSLMESGLGVPLMTTSPERLPELPDVISVTELGMRTVGSGNWQTIFAKASTRDDVVDALRAAIRSTITSERAIEQLANANAQIVFMDSEAELREWYDTEIASLAEALEAVTLEPED